MDNMMRQEENIEGTYWTCNYASMKDTKLGVSLVVC